MDAACQNMNKKQTKKRTFSEFKGPQGRRMIILWMESEGKQRRKGASHSCSDTMLKPMSVKPGFYLWMGEIFVGL